MINDSPKITVEETHHSIGKEPGSWLFGWRIENHTDAPMQLLTARLPHGKFRSGEIVFQPLIEIAGRENAAIELPALCHEASGSVVENAFVILTVEWQGIRWRIFVRLRVTCNADGEPGTKTELISLQKVGFSTML